MSDDKEKGIVESKTDIKADVQAPVDAVSGSREVPLDANLGGKSRWERSWPTIACGAGLFSDGYLNGVCGFLTLIHDSLPPSA